MLSRYVALLRAVNVGGRGAISMGDLKVVAERAGFGEVATILQTGNLVFSAAGEPAALEAKLEEALTAKLSLATEVMVRTDARWRALMAANPFPDLAANDPSHLVLLVLKGKAPPGAEAALARVIVGREQVVVADDAAFIAYPDGIGRSKLTPALLQRHLGSPGTGRNWNSVARIAAKLGP